MLNTLNVLILFGVVGLFFWCLAKVASGRDHEDDPWLGSAMIVIGLLILLRIMINVLI